jgi:hypothetical protein
MQNTTQRDIIRAMDARDDHATITGSRWHVEPLMAGTWWLGNRDGRHLRRRFFTPESAQSYADQLSVTREESR